MSSAKYASTPQQDEATIGAIDYLLKTIAPDRKPLEESVPAEDPEEAQGSLRFRKRLKKPWKPSRSTWILVRKGSHPAKNRTRGIMPSSHPVRR